MLTLRFTYTYGEVATVITFFLALTYLMREDTYLAQLARNLFSYLLFRAKEISFIILKSCLKAIPCFFCNIIPAFRKLTISLYSFILNIVSHVRSFKQNFIPLQTNGRLQASNSSNESDSDNAGLAEKLTKFIFDHFVSYLKSIFFSRFSQEHDASIDCDSDESTESCCSCCSSSDITRISSHENTNDISAQGLSPPPKTSGQNSSHPSETGITNTVDEVIISTDQIDISCQITKSNHELSNTQCQNFIEKENASLRNEQELGINESKTEYIIIIERDIPYGTNDELRNRIGGYHRVREENFPDGKIEGGFVENLEKSESRKFQCHKTDTQGQSSPDKPNQKEFATGCSETDNRHFLYDTEHGACRGSLQQLDKGIDSQRGETSNRWQYRENDDFETCKCNCEIEDDDKYSRKETKFVNERIEIRLSEYLNEEESVSPLQSDKTEKLIRTPSREGYGCNHVIEQCRTLNIHEFEHETNDVNCDTRCVSKPSLQVYNKIRKDVDDDKSEAKIEEKKCSPNDNQVTRSTKNKSILKKGIPEEPIRGVNSGTSIAQKISESFESAITKFSNLLCASPPVNSTPKVSFSLPTTLNDTGEEQEKGFIDDDDKSDSEHTNSQNETSCELHSSSNSKSDDIISKEHQKININDQNTRKNDSCIKINLLPVEPNDTWKKLEKGNLSHDDRSNSELAGSKKDSVDDLKFKKGQKCYNEREKITNERAEVKKDRVKGEQSDDNINNKSQNIFTSKSRLEKNDSKTTSIPKEIGRSDVQGGVVQKPLHTVEPGRKRNDRKFDLSSQAVQSKVDSTRPVSVSVSKSSLSDKTDSESDSKVRNFRKRKKSNTSIESSSLNVDDNKHKRNKNKNKISNELNRSKTITTRIYRDKAIQTTTLVTDTHARQNRPSPVQDLVPPQPTHNASVGKTASKTSILKKEPRVSDVPLKVRFSENEMETSNEFTSESSTADVSDIPSLTCMFR